ncbi:MAG: hypothetical protein IJY79_01180 [Clostridia bacterium]|nr:hypothetical protein [Clostridia bacterium]
MDNRYLENVIKEMQPFLDENGFKAVDGVYKNDKKAAAVEYSDERQMYILKTADIAEDGSYELAEVNAWLFDDSQNAKDAEAVGIDFTSTLRDELGIKRTRSAAATNAIDLPTASKDGSYNITAFTKKVLDVFPALKDEYKAHVAVYGNFLYLNFFGEKLVPQIKAVLLENNKKSIKKLFDVLGNGYLQGDRDTVNTIVAVVAAACVNDETVKANAIAALGDNKHFIDSVTQFIPVVSSNKKLSAALLK